MEGLELGAPRRRPLILFFNNIMAEVVEGDYTNAEQEILTQLIILSAEVAPIYVDMIHATNQPQFDGLLVELNAVMTEFKQSIPIVNTNSIRNEGRLQRIMAFLRTNILNRPAVNRFVDELNDLILMYDGLRMTPEQELRSKKNLRRAVKLGAVSRQLDEPGLVRAFEKRCVCGSQEHLSLCSRCKGQYYCSRECQVADWPNHKLVCNPVEPALSRRKGGRKRRSRKGIYLNTKSFLNNCLGLRMHL
jgi:hypothetical protein